MAAKRGKRSDRSRVPKRQRRPAAPKATYEEDLLTLEERELRLEAMRQLMPLAIEFLRSKLELPASAATCAGARLAEEVSRRASPEQLVLVIEDDEGGNGTPH